MALNLQVSFAVLALFLLSTFALGQELAVEKPDESVAGKVAQFEASKEGEVTFAEAEKQDANFDEQFDTKTSDESVPATPDLSAVQQLLTDDEGNSAMSRAPSDFNAEEAKQALQSRSSSFCWGSSWVNNNGCCRRVDNYGCRSTSQCLPCFWHYTYYLSHTQKVLARAERSAEAAPVQDVPAFIAPSVKQWCCPIWPRQYISNCTCKNCFVQQAYGVKSGTCRRRYTRRTFFAACYSHGHWYGQFITKYLPTSCYCRLNSNGPC